MNISHPNSSYRCRAVFVLAGAGSPGIPRPGETTLITAGTGAEPANQLSPWLILTPGKARQIERTARPFTGEA